MSWKKLAIAAAVIAAMLAGVGAFWWSRRPVAKAQAPPVAPMAQEVTLEAVLQPANTVSIPVPIEGRIESFEVELGADVYEGQLLARIRSEVLESARDAAQLDYEKTEGRVHNLEAAISAARLEASRANADASRVRNDLDRAQKAFERQKMLLSEGATPRRIFEKAQTEYEALAAESKKLDAVAASSDERISSLQRELDAARKVLEGKAEDAEAAKAHLGSGEVLSPVNGVLAARRGQAGDEVHPSMTDLFQIATDMSRMYAIADIKTAEAGRVKPGQAALVSIAEVSGAGLTGVVTKVEDGKITVEFANPDPTLKPGVTAFVRIKLT